MAARDIVFFDLETTIPAQKGGSFHILEFAAVVVSPRGFREVRSFHTLVRPSSLGFISARSIKTNGITPDDVRGERTFQEVAPEIYELLHGRIWAGHNIKAFDSVRTREAFMTQGLHPPEPQGCVDTLQLLRRRFGTRAGDMKMASLGSFCGLGKQRHRALADVRMNIDVFKQCAATLLLESEEPELFVPPPAGGAPSRGPRASDTAQQEARGTQPSGQGLARGTPSSSSSARAGPWSPTCGPTIEVLSVASSDDDDCCNEDEEEVEEEEEEEEEGDEFEDATDQMYDSSGGRRLFGSLLAPPWRTATTTAFSGLHLNADLPQASPTAERIGYLREGGTAGGAGTAPSAAAARQAAPVPAPAQARAAPVTGPVPAAAGAGGVAAGASSKSRGGAEGRGAGVDRGRGRGRGRGAGGRGGNGEGIGGGWEAQGRGGSTVGGGRWVQESSAGHPNTAPPRSPPPAAATRHQEAGGSSRAPPPTSEDWTGCGVEVRAPRTGIVVMTGFALARPGRAGTSRTRDRESQSHEGW